ncbi:MAG: ABC transporter substrate-binding protein [Spirochaetales bacterium]|nr:ABC transporter substrate-binding protein [Spirochaetales bacterium]
MQKKCLVLLLLALFFILPAFSTGTREVDNPIVITDSTGNTVRLKSLPQRITFVGRASIMVADALYMFPEVLDRLVGVGFTNQGRGEFIADIDPGYAEKICLQHTVGPEQIAATRPDMVIMKSFLKESLGDSVTLLGIPVVYLRLETPELYLKDFEVIGQILGNTERADFIKDYYTSSLEMVSNRTSGIENRPKVLFLYHSARDGIVAFNVPPLNWIQSMMVELAGGEPVWTGGVIGNGWTKVNFEQIAVWDPDQIFLVAYKQEEKKIIERLKNDPQWKELAAVQADKLFAFPVDYYSWDQPDSRWILGLSWLAKQIHPELFSDLDIEELTKDFFLTLYPMDESQYRELILPKLGW